VKVTPSTFWGQRLEASRNVTVPLAFSKCESEGRYKNFENAAAHLKADEDSCSFYLKVPFLKEALCSKLKGSKI
jgi:hypothetical protein